MLNKCRGSVKDYISFEDETFQASSILPGEVSLVNRYLSVQCRGTQALGKQDVLDQISRYIDLQIEPTAVTDAKEFVAQRFKRGSDEDEQISAYTRRKEERRKEIGARVIADIREKPIDVFLMSVGDFIIAQASKSAQTI